MKITSLIFFIICLSTITNALKTESNDEKIKKLEGNLLSHYIAGKATEVLADLESIKALDETIYTRDSEIIDYWYYIDDKMPLYEGVAPDGLPGSDHAFVVLGYALNSDGSLRPEAKGRCDVAYESAIKYPNSKVYVTGGGTASHNKTATEAGQMRAYLIEKGLDPNRIVLEDKAMSTVSNARNTVKLLYQNQIKSITVITSDYHIRRGNILFKGEIMMKASTYSSSPIEMVENAVYKTGKSTEGKYMEGVALASIMGVDIKTILFFAHLPEVLLYLMNYF